MSFYNLPGYRQQDALTSYIEEHVQPTSWEMTPLGEAVDQLVRYLHRFNEAVPGEDYRVSRVLKSGSLGRETAVQNKMDIDLVVFMQKFTTMTDFHKELPHILANLERYVMGYTSLKVLQRNQYMVKCLLTDNGTKHSVDIFPAVDLIACVGGVAAVHKEMRGLKGILWSGPLDHYSVCFAEMQTKFVKRHTDSKPQITDLIRLVKYWSKVNGLARVSYCFELVCIHVYKEYDGGYRYSVEDLFKKVMEKLCRIEKLDITFSDYYTPSDYQKYWKVPYVMDPVNPFNNTLRRTSGKLTEVARKAGETLKGPSHHLRNCIVAGIMVFLFILVIVGFAT